MLYSLKSFKVDWKRPFMLNHAIDNGLAKLESFMGVRVAERNGPAVQHLLMRNQCFLDTFDEVCRSGRIDTFCLESRPEIQTSIVPERPTRGFGDEPWLSVLIPIESIAHKGVNAVLFVGTNTRRPYDADYEAFMADLARAISSSLAALILTNEQKRRVGEALQMEQRAVSMLEASPVGSALLNMQGTILYANSSWHRITGYSFDTIPFSWLEMMIDESAVKAQKEWGFVVGEQRLERTFELALKKPWSYTDSATGEVVKDGTHVLVSALVQRIGEEDFVISVVTDISYQKWMESLQDQRRQQALDMKRAQENFMDMTSHEMRNPLSAIFQCADAIVSSLSAYQKNGYGMPDLSPTSSQGSQQRRTGLAGTTSGLDEAIAHAIENAGTITLCAQHQRVRGRGVQCQH
jgi:PAS domain S-box-containing protein